MLRTDAHSRRRPIPGRTSGHALVARPCLVSRMFRCDGTTTCSRACVQFFRSQNALYQSECREQNIPRTASVQIRPERAAPQRRPERSCFEASLSANHHDLNCAPSDAPLRCPQRPVVRSFPHSNAVGRAAHPPGLVSRRRKRGDAPKRWLHDLRAPSPLRSCTYDLACARRSVITALSWSTTHTPSRRDKAWHSQQPGGARGTSSGARCRSRRRRGRCCSR